MVRGAVAAVFAALVMYVWGFWNAYTPDVGEACDAHHQPWDWAGYRQTLFPISHTCNARFDLVPSYVNPSIYALLALAVVLAVLAVVKKNHRGKP